MTQKRMVADQRIPDRGLDRSEGFQHLDAHRSSHRLLRTHAHAASKRATDGQRGTVQGEIRLVISAVSGYIAKFDLGAIHELVDRRRYQHTIAHGTDIDERVLVIDVTALIDGEVIQRLLGVDLEGRTMAGRECHEGAGKLEAQMNLIVLVAIERQFVADCAADHRPWTALGGGRRPHIPRHPGGGGR